MTDTYDTAAMARERDARLYAQWLRALDALAAKYAQKEAANG